MRGRTALYGPRHVLQLVAIKRLQAQGLSLAAVQERVVGLSDAALKRLTSAEPAATTAEGAAAALDHVLNDESLWSASDDYPGEVFLRRLIKTARDYIIRTAKP